MEAPRRAPRGRVDQPMAREAEITLPSIEEGV
jgi:hypothetical protein